MGAGGAVVGFASALAGAPTPRWMWAGAAVRVSAVAVVCELLAHPSTSVLSSTLAHPSSSSVQS